MQVGRNRLDKQHRIKKNCKAKKRFKKDISLCFIDKVNINNSHGTKQQSENLDPDF